MKDGSTTSFVVATGPQVSVDTVLGLLLIIATGMIINFVDKVVEAKRYDCPPFKKDFCRATKNIPATDDKAPTTHYIEFKNVQQILQKTNAYIAGVCKELHLDPVSKVKISSMNCCFPLSDSDTVNTSTLSTNHSYSSIGSPHQPSPRGSRILVSSHYALTRHHWGIYENMAWLQSIAYICCIRAIVVI
jgi:hypothetical protein